MELKRELRGPFVASVSRYLGPNPHAIARDLLGASAVSKEPAIGVNLPAYAAWVVRYALNFPTPRLFIRLVEEVDDAGVHPELHALVAQLKADESLWTAPPPAGLWVPPGWPFIDRTPVRETLAKMAAGDGPAALAVEGPFGHGKRTIGEYVRTLAEETEGFVPAVVELRREPHVGVLERITLELAMALGHAMDPHTTHAEPERRGVVYAREIATQALKSPVTAWFVAIVVDHAGIEDGVLAFVDELLLQLNKMPTLAAKLRVLVFCEQLSLLELDNVPPLDARHALTQVTADDVREWLEAAAPGKEPALYELTANTVLETASESAASDAARRLRLVSSKCAAAQRTLAATADL